MINQHDDPESTSAATDFDDPAFEGVSLPDAVDAVDAAVLAALNTSDAPNPVVGQLWRLSAGPNAPVVLAWARQIRTPETIAVVPVSFDVSMADDYSLIIAADDGPLGVDLVLHTTAESTVDRRSLLNVVGVLDVIDEVQAVRTARRNGDPASGLNVGAPIASVTDERFEFRQQLSESLAALATAAFEPDASEDDSGHDLPSTIEDEVLLDQLVADPATSAFIIHVMTGLGMPRPEIRLLPAGRVTVIDGVRIIGDLIEVDEVLRLAGFSAAPEPSFIAGLAHEVFALDPSVLAMCFAPFSTDGDAWLVNRRSHRGSFTSSGAWVDDATFWTGPILELLMKYFDRFVDPFAHVLTPAVNVLAIDTRALGVDKGAQAVRDQVARAAGFKMLGKTEGYQGVENHRDAVISAVDQALNRDIERVDLEALLGGDR